jgi:hypothetical protein
MKFMKAGVRSVVALAALTLWVCFAADIDGKWSAQVQGPRGTRTEFLNLKSDGNTLTGSIQGGRGEGVAISNGMIDGDTISFTVVRQFRDNQITEQYKGTISGGQLKLTVSGGRRGPVEMTYKREQ